MHNFFDIIKEEGSGSLAEVARYARIKEMNFRPIIYRMRKGLGTRIKTRKKLLNGLNKAFSKDIAFNEIDFTYHS